MKKIIAIILCATLLISCDSASKSIHQKVTDINYEIPYENTFFKIKNIEFFYDEYNYSYIHYMRMWLDLSAMDEKQERWFLDGYDYKTSPSAFNVFGIGIPDVPKSFGLSIVGGNLKLLQKDYNKEEKTLFYFFGGEQVKDKENWYDISISREAGSDWNSKEKKLDYYYNYYDYDFSETSNPLAIKFENLDLSQYESLKNSFRKANLNSY